jgi:uncharacterized protein
MKNELKYSIIFIIIVLLLSWTLTAILFSDEKTVGLFPLMMFLPAIISIIINFIRFKSVKKVFKPIINKINLKSILFSILYPILFILIIALIVSMTGIANFNSEKLQNLLSFPSIDTIIIGFLLIFGEEYGWRGFLLKELNAYKGKIFSAIIVGIVWALWHGPAIYGLTNYYNMDNPILISFIQMGAVFVFSIPFAYSYFLSGNIFPPMLFHFIWNYYNPIVLGNIYQNNPGIIEGNLMLINGEGLAGIILGSLFVLWYFNHYNPRKANQL